MLRRAAGRPELSGPTWQHLLDAYETTVVRVEHALSAGQDVPTLAPFEPPTTQPETESTPAEVARLDRLHGRAAACAEGIRRRLQDTGQDLADSRRSRLAARAYEEARHLTGS